MSARRRGTDLTPEQQAAVDEARRLLQPLFPGEVVRLYIPKVPPAVRQQRLQKVLTGLAANHSHADIARRAGCSTRYVRRMQALRRGPRE